ncbi:ClpXP protease specificity-enhancing factor [Neisseria sp. Ec49-e6-T10]|uniref:ClpXP protease specificity-enhancing factor n=1 Tax=Neisseria sp. Ec49-e6-T10 TaxID=3140744 RepID=UPI003EBADD45
MSISTKPYFIRALYEWCIDSQHTPYLVVWVNAQTQVPMQYVKDDQIVLSIGPNAVKDLQLDNDWIHFNARFSGKVYDVWVPVNNVVSVFAKETGEGMSFPIEEDQLLVEVPKKESSTKLSTTPAEENETQKTDTTHLKIIK